MINLIYIALGGALGSVLRYLCVSGVQKFNTTVFPYGTFSVNLIGSLLIGLLWGLALEQKGIHINIRNLLFVGILGGFTTFSSFSLENLKLFQDGYWRIALGYILASNILGILLAFTGYSIGQKI